MRLRNYHFSSPEADRRFMAWLSFPLMLLFWIFLAFMLFVMVGSIIAHEDYDAGQIGWAVFLALLVLLLIPIQLVRYLRGFRKRG